MRKKQTLVAMGPILVLLYLPLGVGGGQTPASQETMLEIVVVRFEPLQQGKNVVHVQVRNTSDRDQMFRIHIYTRSPEYGRGGVGWEKGPFLSLELSRVVRSGERLRLLAYRRLTNSSNTDVHEQNVQTLSDIYGAPLAELDQRWQEGIEHGNL